MLYQSKESQISEHVMRQFEKAVMLQTLDACWREHLAAMDYLRQGIHLRGYAQKNPKQEYKRESFEMFAQLLDKINYDVISGLSRFEVKVEQDVERIEAQRRQAANLQHVQFKHAEPTVMEADTAVGLEEPVALAGIAAPFVRELPKVGRNDACPCNSGKKYKQCHGKLGD